MARENTPAQTGTIKIASNIGASSTIFTWPMVTATNDLPALDVILRVRSDGVLFISIDHRWDDTHWIHE